MTFVTTRTSHYFDQVVTRLLLEPEGEVIQELIARVEEVRRALPTEEWRAFVRETAQRHPLAELLRSDPLTQRGFHRPRGYDGDAVMFDYIYFGLYDDFKHDRKTTELGKLIFSQTVGSGAALALRNRRRILAQYIDETAARVQRPIITTLACAHLREANLSEAFQRGDVGTWYCLDQDRECLALLDAQYETNPAVITREVNVHAFLQPELSLPISDFIFAPGLLAELADQVAAALLERMFEATKPGGHLLVTNFTPDMEERGYLEAFMDWWLYYRSEDELRRLTKDLPSKEIASIKLFTEETGHIIFLEIVRKQSRLRDGYEDEPTRRKRPTPIMPVPA